MGGLRIVSNEVSSPRVISRLSRRILDSLGSSLRLLRRTNSPFSGSGMSGNRLAPLFFNSTVAGFNMRAFLRGCLRLTPPPRRERALRKRVTPRSPTFSTFIFGVRTGVSPGRRSHVTFLHVYSNVFRGNTSMLRQRDNGVLQLSRPRRFLTARQRAMRGTCPKSVVKVFSAKRLNINSAMYRGGSPIAFVSFPMFPPRLFTHLSPRDDVGQGRFLGNIDRLTRRNTVRVCGRPCVVRSFVVNTINRLRFRIVGCHLRGRCGIAMGIRPVDCAYTH